MNSRALGQRLANTMERLREIHRTAATSPDRLRLAWRQFEQTGTLPQNEHQRRFVMNLAEATREVDGLHRVAVRPLRQP